jgi:hypothetical protein
MIVQKIPEQMAYCFLLAPLFPDNIHYIPTQSTISRQHLLCTDNVHYFQTCSTFSRQKVSIFTNTFLTRLRLQPSETFQFPFRSPPPFGAPTSQPCGQPADPAGQASRP